MTTVLHMTTTQLLTTAEVAEILGCSPRTVARMADNGELEAAHKHNGLRGAYLFEKAAVDVVARRKTNAA